MKIRDLLINLLKHDIDLDVFLVNGQDLMSPSILTDARIVHQPIGTPPKLYDTELIGLESLIGNITGHKPVDQDTKPNAVIMMWM